MSFLPEEDCRRGKYCETLTKTPLRGALLYGVHLSYIRPTASYIVIGQ